MRLRRSDMTSIERARSRILRMTIKIVVVFIFCWTPYITMSLWYVIDKQSAKEVDELLQESLFIMAVGNSCANPLVYGSYAIDLKKECCRCFLPCTTASRRSNVDVHLIQRSIVGSGQTKSTNVVGLNKALAVVQAPAGDDATNGSAYQSEAVRVEHQRQQPSGRRRSDDGKSSALHHVQSHRRIRDGEFRRIDSAQ
ncbi:unnamed protein product [Trichogramma brassicae]|uniref:G-protein coupled receptors family 1 profile domain-containing protein n=1 Tax=Trichogramma brassicae TaxID=86971 RepID=A0A6H5I7V0_9HYME|nr:unnamed protein product [Trichogramma brassicae]